MKNILMGLVLVATATASAQSSSTQLPATATTTTGAPPVQTLTTTSTQEQKSFLKENFGANFASENSMPMYFAKDPVTGESHDAPVLSLWTMGLKWKATKKISAEIAQQYWSRSHLHSLAGSETAYFGNGKSQNTADPYIKGGYASELRFLGSEPLAFSARYYIPVANYTREAHRNGSLRADVAPAWNINPRWTFELPISPRIVFNSPNSKFGSDAIYRLVWGAGITYNFDDKLNAYTAATADWRSVDIQRGEVRMDQLDLITPEVGMNVVVGPVTVNPSISSDVNIKDNTAKAFSEESRIFSYETNSYNLNVLASF